MTDFATNMNKIIGAHIRDLRKEAGLTQAHLAKFLDISYQQVQKYETGVNRVSAARLAQMALYLKVDVSVFYSDESIKQALNGEAAADLPHGGRNRQSIQVVRDYESIPDPATRTQVAGLIKTIAQSQQAA